MPDQDNTRRVCARTPLDARVVLRLTGEGDVEGDAIQGVFCDISRGGAGVLVPREIEPESIVLLEVMIDGRPFALKCRVIWESFSPLRGIKVGLRFQQAHESEELFARMRRGGLLAR